AAGTRTNHAPIISTICTNNARSSLEPASDSRKFFQVHRAGEFGGNRALRSRAQHHDCLLPLQQFRMVKPGLRFSRLEKPDHFARVQKRTARSYFSKNCGSNQATNLFRGKAESFVFIKYCAEKGAPHCLSTLRCIQRCP